MAKEDIVDQLKIITMDKQEAVDLIGLLAAQLADVALTGNMSGAAPSINVVDKGVIKYRLSFLLERKSEVNEAPTSLLKLEDSSSLEENKCRCGSPGEDSHPCPYQSDVNNDYETECNCCGRCQHNCAMDI